MWIRVCRYKNAGVADYAEAFIPVQSDSHTSEWYSYFANALIPAALILFLLACCFLPRLYAFCILLLEKDLEGEH